MDWLDTVYWNNTVTSYLIAAGLVLAVVVGVWIVRVLLRSRLRKLAELTENQLDDLAMSVIDATRNWLVLGVGLQVGSIPLVLPSRVAWFVEKAASTSVLIQIGFWVSAALVHWSDTYIELRIAAGKGTSGAARVVSVVGRALAWAGVLLIALQGFGVNVSALVAGLGIGGIAVALALQNILGDVFASLSITLDRPFEIGDFIVVGDLMGTVEIVGVKTTRLRSLSGEMLVFANTDLLGARIRNFKKMEERRAVFTIGITYQTPAERVEAIPGMIKDAIEAEGEDTVRFDRAHFKSFGDSALVYEAVYYMLNPDYNLYMDVQERINQRLFVALQKAEVEFAYPTQTIWIEKQAA